MTPDETKKILAYMLAAWPNHKLDEMGALVWSEHLADIPADQAIDTARTLVDNNPWFPTVSEFRETWRRDSGQAQQYALPEPPGPRLPPEEVRARIAAMKGQIKRVDTVLGVAPPPGRRPFVPTINEDNDPANPQEAT